MIAQVASLHVDSRAKIVPFLKNVLEKVKKKNFRVVAPKRSRNAPVVDAMPDDDLTETAIQEEDVAGVQRAPQSDDEVEEEVEEDEEGELTSGDTSHAGNEDRAATFVQNPTRVTRSKGRPKKQRRAKSAIEAQPKRTRKTRQTRQL